MTLTPSADPSDEVGESRQRLHARILGAVQGVGFRPFVYRLACELGLDGWVQNSARGVVVEVEGTGRRLEDFLLRLQRESPPRASIQGLEPSFLDPVGHEGFQVRQSEVSGAKRALVLPDIATCADCLREIHDPTDRRYRYPFTNCTNCGPRFSIILGLPYDRSRTTMKEFTMCAACQAEYEDPGNRRFHAQPNACPECGPHLELWNVDGKPLALRQEAITETTARLLRGEIVAVKGLGGFHLMVDATNDDAVRRLRERKRREEKPFAVMVATLEHVRDLCDVSDVEERLVTAPEAPIVLLRAHRGREDGSKVSSQVAPGNPRIGLILPYTPLHHLLVADLGRPVVATSGNLSDEPICTDQREALRRLGGIADAFLIHDRPIARHVDDSLARILAGRELVLRRARGYAPLPVEAGARLPPILGVGAHLKSSVALSIAGNIFVSQHIGDLETAEAFEAFRSVIDDLGAMYEVQPEAVACDLHPDYLSTRHATSLGLPLFRIQHHHAHVVSCMLENDLEGPVLGVSWDGTGFGPDGTVWGGEFLLSTRSSCRRVAHLRTFRLPGGDRAVREPRRSALGLLHEVGRLDDSRTPTPATIRAFSSIEIRALRRMLTAGTHAPRTSSVGRLFDGVASLCGLRQVCRHEGQAAMELEFALAGVTGESRYPMEILEGSSEEPLVVDWEPAVAELLADLERSASVAEISLRFHNALVEAIVRVAEKVGTERVALTGGCFQNEYLTETSIRKLREAGFRPYWHQRIPPNDGGIALGQVAACAALRGLK